jgi:hypothetical protein
MATEGLVKNRMERPLKENRTDQSEIIDQGAHVSSLRILHCRCIGRKYMYVVMEGLFSVVEKIKKNLIYYASVGNHREACVSC